ncbi:hypothetical protein A2Y99_05385 [Candidatus Gottesmanbacteria bacterium RBG_13_37_7]|uniref:Uncharacterized protein n=1 Tax=Candidatus Gottesmanbacteria bacterium RBG_13_37_7 TaxID=1798369 RepID=A0A1F5YI16_9BACT|nr:MAG: hypothetical protein A2Y99_05385 [Candidatus Gottesmanbacteria bacterium RBG_13_37_7]
MREENFFSIKNKIIGGVFALTTRTLILQIIAFISTFILTVLLTPSVFGIFFIVSAIISFLSYFSDIGLAAALIQKKDEPSDDELKTVFTIQQILVGSLIILVYFFSPYLIRFYQIEGGGLFLLRALLVSFFLSSLKTIPSVLMERKLEFGLLIIPQIAETLVFYLVAIIMAYFGMGVVSFAWAALFRGLVGLILIYLIYPWKIKIGISKPVIKHLLTFGIPFQVNSILALVKDDLMTIFLGKILPLSQIGYIGWAKKWAEAPLRLIMDNIIKVTFPAYSRLQQNKKILGIALGKSLFFLSVFIFPAVIFLVIFIKPMIAIIPKYQKWEPALISFYLFCFSSVMAAFSSPLINALNALGRIKTTLKIMVLWTVMTWLITPIFVLLFGFNGVALSLALISVTAIIPVVITRKLVYFPIIKSIFKPFISSIVVLLFMIFLLLMGGKPLMVFFVLITGIIIYLLFIVIWMKDEIRGYLPKFLTKK